MRRLVDDNGWPPRFRLRSPRSEHPFRDLARCVTGAIGLRRLR